MGVPGSNHVPVREGLEVVTRKDQRGVGEESSWWEIPNTQTLQGEYYHPEQRINDDGSIVVSINNGGGSGDFKSTRKSVRHKLKGTEFDITRETGTFTWSGVIESGEDMWNIPGSIVSGNNRGEADKRKGRPKRVKVRVNLRELGKTSGDRWSEGILPSDGGDSVSYRPSGFKKREFKEKPEGVENRRGQGRDAHCKRVLRVSKGSGVKRFSAKKVKDCKAAVK